MMRAIRNGTLAGLLGLVLCGFPSCHFPTHDNVFTTEHLLTADAADLPSTVVTPHLAEPIQAGRNVLWCGTFQLVWNEVCSLIGEDIRLTDEPAMVAELNRKQFTRADLDDASYVALAGFVLNDIFRRIKLALADKFHGRATPRFLPSPDLTPRPQDIVAYAYLFKHLEFPRPFERLPDKMSFQGQDVPVFGLGEFKEAHRKLYGQVTILDYESGDDFVIELKTRSPGDRLILAKVAPGATLEATVADVQARTAGAEPTSMLDGDVLSVPKLNFDLTREYRELYGRFLLASNPAVAKDLMVLSALQNIRFQMDEKGVRLKSEASMSFGCDVVAPPQPVHVLVFDKPFLILMQRAGTHAPYFALWVGNAELLVK